MSSYFVRSAGSEAPLSAVLAARHYRIYLMFTGLAIKMGKLALPVIVARGIIKRDHFELLPLPLFVAAVLQYVTFKQGAEVHIFWPHYFAAYFALAAGALAASIAELIVWLGGRVRAGAMRSTFARAAPWTALALVGLPLALVLKDGLSLVRMARETGGRFAEANLDSDIERTTMLRWFLARLPQSVGVAYSRERSRQLGGAMGDVATPVDAESIGRQCGRRSDAHLHPRHARDVAGRPQVRGRALSRARRRLTVGDGPRRAGRADRRLCARRARALVVAVAVARSDRADAQHPPEPVGHLGVAHAVRSADGTDAGPGHRRRSTRSGSRTTWPSTLTTTRRRPRCGRASWRR